jgi:hypothetical protein
MSIAEHETNLDLITDDTFDTECDSCRCFIPKGKPYIGISVFRDGDELAICVSCIKKAREIVGRVEFETKTYLM